MANTLQIKRSTTAGNAPTLDVGELGVNLTDRKLWVGGNGAGNIALGGDGLFLKADGKPDAHTKLLIHSDTHDGSTVFTDSSASGHTVTTVGDTYHKAGAGYFGATGMSFDGTGDYLSVADHADWNFGSGDFTIDLWLNATTFNHGAYPGVFSQGDGSNFLSLYFNSAGNKLYLWGKSGGSGFSTLEGSVTWSTNTWYHVAVVRKGTTTYLFRDGILIDSATESWTVPDFAAPLKIGYWHYGTDYPFKGYIDEFRISKGIARWTAAFTPPTRPYSYVNLNSNLNVAGYLEAPNIDGKPDAYTKLLIHSDTTDGRGTFTDSSPSGHAISTVSDPTHETDKSKFGASSIYFDGNDRLQIASHADWAFGTGDFTVDCWVNKSATVAWETFLDTYSDGGNGFICGLYGSNSQIAFYSEATNTWSNGGGTVLALNTWYHLAWVRDGNNFRMFVDGVQQGSTFTFSASDTYTAGLLLIGSRNAANYINGYMDEVRISKGIARWTAAFTPPTRPYATFSAGDGVFTGELLTPRLGVGSFNTGSLDYALNVEGKGRFTAGLTVVGGLTSSGNFNIAGSGTFSSGTGTSTFSSDVVPSVDNSKALGNASYRWAGLHAVTATLGGLLTGTTATFNSTGLANAPTLAIDNTSTNTYVHSLEAFTANITSGQTNILVVGRAGSTKNAAYIGYKYSSAGSDDNLLTLGHWGANHLLTINGAGAATFSGALTGTSATFSGVVTTGGRTNDGNATSYTWRAVNNTSDSATNYVKIARITATQSSRFLIELGGRSTSYGDTAQPAMGYIVGQLNNDNNYDIVFYSHESGVPKVVEEVGQVDVDATKTDIYVKVSYFSEVTAHAHISDGTITVDSTSGTTEPTNYVAATTFKVWNSGNDGAGSGLDADLLDGQHGSYYLPVSGGTLTGALTGTTGTFSGRIVGLTAGFGNTTDAVHLGHETGYGIVQGTNTSGTVFCGLRLRTQGYAITIPNAAAPDVTIENGLTVGGNTQLPNGYQFQWGGANNAIFGHGTNNYVAIKTNGLDRLKIDSGGTHNLYGNSTVNSASVQALQDGASYDFDGSNDHVDFGSSITFTTGAFTVAAWIKCDAVGTGYHNIVGPYSNNIGHLCVHTNGKLAVWDTESPAAWRYSNTALTTGKWHHVVAVFDGDDGLFYYLDGVSDSAELNFGGTAAGKACTLQYLGIGALTGGDQRRFNGSMRDVKIMPSALTAGEAAKLYSGENPKKNLGGELVVNGTFADLTGWTSNVSGTSTITYQNNKAKLNDRVSSACDLQNTAAIPTVSGKWYLARATFGGDRSNNGGAGSWFKWSIGHGSGWTYHDPGYGASGDGGSHGGDRFAYFKATATTAYIKFTNGGDAGYVTVEKVSIQEVGTMVDLNPQSVSPTIWNNEANLMLNGTVVGASASGGNSAWGNITQDRYGDVSFPSKVRIGDVSESMFGNQYPLVVKESGMSYLLLDGSDDNKAGIVYRTNVAGACGNKEWVIGSTQWQDNDGDLRFTWHRPCAGTDHVLRLTQAGAAIFGGFLTTGDTLTVGGNCFPSVDNGCYLGNASYRWAGLSVSGTINASTAIIGGTIAGTTGAFSGALTGTTGAFSGALTATTGGFSDIITNNAGHGTARMQLKYWPSNDAWKGTLTLWVSEPGITYHDAGIGANINVNGQYYGRQVDNGWGVYARFSKAYGTFEVWNTTGASGTGGGQGTKRLEVGSSGHLTLPTGGLTTNGGVTVNDTNLTLKADVPVLRLHSTHSEDAWADLEVAAALEFFNDDPSTAAASVRGHVKLLNRADGWGNKWALGFGTSTSNATATTKMLLDHTGFLGIGTSAPDVLLKLKYGGDDPAGTNPRVGAFSIEGGHTTLDMGVNNDGPYNGWIQTRHKALGTYPTAYYSLEINPLGGNVGIGGTPGIWKLYVNGITKINGALEVNGQLAPTSGNTYDLGNSTNTWRNLYLKGTAEIDSTLTVGGVITNHESKPVSIYGFASNHTHTFYVAGDSDKFYRVLIAANHAREVIVWRTYNETVGGTASDWNNNNATHYGAMTFHATFQTDDWGGHQKILTGWVAQNYTNVLARANLPGGANYSTIALWLRGGAGGSGAIYHYTIRGGNAHASAATVDYTNSLGSADAEYNFSSDARYINPHNRKHYKLATVDSISCGGTLVATGNFTTQGYVQHTGYLYSRNNLAVLNAAGTGWNTWATRSSGQFNLNVGTITSGALTATTVRTSESQLNDVTKLYIDNTGGLPTAGTQQGGAITFRSYLGDSNMRDAAEIRGVYLGVAGDSNKNRGGLVFRTMEPNGLADRMLINEDGQVGINTTDPKYRLQVNGDIALGPQGASTTKTICSARSDGGSTNRAAIRFVTNSNNDEYLEFDVLDSGVAGYAGAFKIDYTGNCGINGSPGAYKLYVAGTTRLLGAVTFGASGAGNSYTLPNVDGTANYVLKTNGSGTVSWGQIIGDSLTNSIVSEAKLKVSNVPTNGYVLTARSGNAGGMTWEAASGGGGGVTGGNTGISIYNSTTVQLDVSGSDSCVNVHTAITSPSIDDYMIISDESASNDPVQKCKIRHLPLAKSSTFSASGCGGWLYMHNPNGVQQDSTSISLTCSGGGGS